jgi:N-acetylglucosaminyldiphosphoundecaprenol N-acetyl-beta-D-mannosaminyltransferase
MKSTLDPTSRTYEFAGVPISTLSMDECIAEMQYSIDNERNLEVHLCNAHCVVQANKIPALRSVYNSSDINLPDGYPIAFAGRHFGVKKPVRGPDLMRESFKKLESNSRHFLLGGDDFILGKLQMHLLELNKDAKIVGVYAPPMVDNHQEFLDLYLQAIKKSKANIVWIGIGTPKQDFIASHLADNGIPLVVVPVGAAFNFLSGDISEAPLLLRSSGLEWMYRFAMDPRKLWRRYTIGLLHFGALWIRNYIK